jgi:hypothetical protein
MKRITPVHLGETGTAVSNLHTALKSLLKGESGGGDIAMILKRLEPEVRNRTFGGVTAEVVSIYQGKLLSLHDLSLELKRALPLSPNGDVEQATADALNWLLGKRGAARPKRRPTRERPVPPRSPPLIG